MSERDANQLAADVRAAFRDPDPTDHHRLCASRDGQDCDCYALRSADAHAALDELVALVGTLQQERDELAEAFEGQAEFAAKQIARWQAAEAALATSNDLLAESRRMYALRREGQEAAEAALTVALDAKFEETHRANNADAALATTRQALADALDYTECKGHCADGGCPFCGGVLNIARRALADTGGDTKEHA